MKEETENAIMLGAMLGLGVQKMPMLNDDAFRMLKDQALDSASRIGVDETLDELDALRRMEADQAMGAVVSLRNRLAARIRTRTTPTIADWFEFSFHVTLISTAPDILSQLRSDLQAKSERVGFSSEDFEELYADMESGGYGATEILLGQATKASSQPKKVVSGTAYDVFISYSNRDTSVAEDIAAELRAAGYSVFLAHQTVTVGPQWTDQIANAARSCTVAVLVLSKESLDSDWVRYEIGALWALGKPVAPGLIDLTPADLPGLVSEYQGRPVGSSAERTVFCKELTMLLMEQ